MSNTAEKWESAWIVTEHLPNTAEKWEDSWTGYQFCTDIKGAYDPTAI